MKTVAIIGAGAGGLSVLWKIKQSTLSPLRVIVLDPDPEGIIHRNWCQWVKPDERMPYHSSAWSKVRCRTPRGTYDHQSHDWLYVRTTGGDYRAYVDGYDAGTHQIEWSMAEVLQVRNVAGEQAPFTSYSNDSNQGQGYNQNTVQPSDALNTSTRSKPYQIVTNQGSFEADMVFSSRPTRTQTPRLWQHFHGWHVEVDRPTFDPSRVTLMDFDVPQLADSVTFFYVLPYSERSALVECTVFSSHVWDTPRYESYLNDYLLDRFGISQANILQQSVETGQIPMDTEHQATAASNGLITMRNSITNNQFTHGYWPIGAEAGAIKPSTGYAFTRIQAMASHLVRSWESGGYPMPLPPRSSRFRWYDALLLGIIRERPEQVVSIFDRLFRHVPIDRTFRFLDERSNLVDEAGIFMHLPKRPFLRQACKHVIP